VVLLGATTLAFGQEAVVVKSTIWIDIVKRGDMIRSVRGVGALAANSTVELRIAETQANDIKPGQRAQFDTRNGLVEGKVVRVLPGVSDGLVKVEAEVAGALPSGAVPGLNVDGVIDVDVLKDVMYVGRPVMASPQSEGVLFKLEPDGQHATKVTVHYGQAGVNTIAVRSGLQPGDKVILSDMTVFAAKDRIRLQ